MKHTVYMHHRNGTLNVWCYRGIKFWWDQYDYVTTGGLRSETIDGIKAEIDRNIEANGG